MTGITQTIASWSPDAQAACRSCAALFDSVAAEAGIGALDNSLKWGQPSWRPIKPRTGATLRLGWSNAAPDTLSIYVDCKTNLAARFSDIYPAIVNDGRRMISFSMPLDGQQTALRHLAAMTFTYHLRKRAG